MALTGKYQHERSENLTEYLKAIGVPYMIRILINKLNPKLVIDNDGDCWTIYAKSWLKTPVMKFKLGEEYIEELPKQILKSKTTLDDGKLITESIGENGDKHKAIYEATETNLQITFIHEASGQVAKRFFKKISI